MPTPSDGPVDQPETAAAPHPADESRSGAAQAVPPPAVPPPAVPPPAMPPQKPEPLGSASPGPWSGLGPTTPSQRFNRPPPPLGPMTRPAGVTAAAVLLYISAGLALLGCCGIAVLVGGETGDYGGLLMLVTGLILFSAAINGVLGYFVMEGKQWARIVAIVLCGLGILVTGVQFVVDAEAVGVGGCFGILYNGIIVGLLSAREASEYFQQSG